MTTRAPTTAVCAVRGAGADDDYAQGIRMNTLTATPFAVHGDHMGWSR